MGLALAESRRMPSRWSPSVTIAGSSYQFALQMLDLAKTHTGQQAIAQAAAFLGVSFEPASIDVAQRLVLRGSAETGCVTRLRRACSDPLLEQPDIADPPPVLIDLLIGQCIL